MKPTGLIVAVALLAALGGVVWWSNKQQASADSKKTDTTAKLLAIPDDQIQNIRIKKAGAEAEDLVRENGKWKLTGPKPLPADQDAVSGITSNLTALNADNVIDEKPTDLKQYGLADPALDIQVRRKDGKTDELLIGDDTPTSSGAYAKLASSPRVVTIAGFVKTSFDKSPNDLRDKRLMTFDQDKITRVDLQAKGQSLEFGKDAQGEWQILKPRPLRADSSAVNGVVDKLRDAKMDLSGGEDASKQFASSSKVAVATVADAAGNHTLEVRKDKDKNYYAKSSDVAGAYKIASDTGDGLDKGLDDFRNKKLFDFGFSDPGKVEVPGAVYEKSGDKWMSAGKAMDNSTVQSLIDKLRDLSATKFVDTAAGQPVFTAAVTSNSGKRVEKVTIRKQGDQYFAQRENEASIYQIDAKSFDDLQSAAKAVKPAAAEQPKKK
ncbi:MAG TPA: DUF4340 domain-containing protein [Bryobacteraceae bacterium]|nr:DUF4340 domain-containing protein [Bryobacteraceae bacterium]